MGKTDTCQNESDILKIKPELLMGYYRYWLLKQFCEAAVCGWHSLLPVKVLQSWYFQMWEWQDATWHRLNSTELKHNGLGGASYCEVKSGAVISLNNPK